MAGLGDMLVGLPSLQTQMAQKLGQGFGSPSNPQPLAAGGGPSPAGNAAPPAAPGGGAAPPGGGGAPPPPVQAYQPTPQAAQQYARLADPNGLMNLYTQLWQKTQQADQINRGVAMMLAGLSHSPQDRAIMVQSGQGMTGDPAGQVGNMMQLWQAQMQMQNQANLMQRMPQMLQEAGIDPTYAPLVAANPSILGDVLKTRMGITGDPAEKALLSARADWLRQNPGKTEGDMAQARPDLANSITYKAATEAAANTAETTAHETAKDKAAGADAFAGANADYQQGEDLLGWLKDHPDATAKAVHMGDWAKGRTGQLAQTVGLVDPETSTAAAKLAQLQGVLFGGAWKGRGGRLSTVEATRITEGFSPLTNTASTDSAIRDSVNELYNKTVKGHANVYGAGGQATPSKYWGQMDEIYKPGGKLFNGAAPLKDDSAPAAGGGAGPGGPKPLSDDQRAKARELIGQHGREAVITHLQAGGWDTSGL